MRLLSAAACGRGTEPAAPEDAELDPLAVTRWTEKTELFAEYPPLVVGQTSRFAIHLTDLRTFKAVTAGQVEVQLQGGGAPETFRVDGPSRPGIFGVDVKPSRAGNRVLVIALKSAGLTDEHRIPDVIVHGDQQTARKAVESAPPKERRHQLPERAAVDARLRHVARRGARASRIDSRAGGNRCPSWWLG